MHKDYTTKYWKDHSSLSFEIHYIKQPISRPLRSYGFFFIMVNEIFFFFFFFFLQGPGGSIS
jgi:hypothetical protein